MGALDGKSAWVTGAGSGIGRATAIALVAPLERSGDRLGPVRLRRDLLLVPHFDAAVREDRGDGVGQLLLPARVGEENLRGEVFRFHVRRNPGR